VKIILVTGSRVWSDKWKMHELLTSLKPDLIVEGGQRGADKMAAAWCQKFGVDFLEAPALWGAYGKPAGRRRNELMLNVCLALREAMDSDLEVAAFPTEESVGTLHMISLCRKVGLEFHTCE
jgi:YspA, cpYpsA-related SLOG family